MRHYIVKKDDNLQKIAKNLLGSSSKWKEIAELNQLQNPDKIYEGQTLIIPEGNNGFSPKNQRDSQRKYYVRYGDTLWKISEKYLGDPSRWGEIARLNRLANPNFLYLSQELVLPDNAHLSSENASKYEQKSIHPRTETIRFGQKPATVIPGIIYPYIFSKANARLYKNKKSTSVLPLLRNDPFLFEQRLSLIGEGILNKKALCLEKDVGNLSNFQENSFFIDFLDSLSEIYHLSQDAIQAMLGTCDEWRATYYWDGFAEIFEGFSKVRNVFPKGSTFFQGVGLVFTSYDLCNACVESYNKISFVPLQREMNNQVFATQFALGGARAGAAVGTILGIELGPGAVLTGAVGSALFGYVGYQVGDFIGSFIYPGE